VACQGGDEPCQTDSRRLSDLYRGQEEIPMRRLALMADLRRAIDHNALSLHFQPKGDIASRRLCGAETLGRWQHPRHGLIPTIELVKLAEQAGMDYAADQLGAGSSL
jgi:predicted signal transduction protein with EAL and GGDEF domain